MAVCKHEWIDIKTICCSHKQCKLCGVINKVSVCDFHKKGLNNYSGKEYFTETDINNFDGIIPLNKNAIIEHENIFKEFKIFNSNIININNVIEIGAGIGRLVPLFLKMNLDYTAFEYNNWASKYIENAYNVKVISDDFVKYEFNKKYDFVVCIHTLEHFISADKIFEKLCSIVKDEGYLFIEVPYKSDLYNPDHYWFFTIDVLKEWGRLNNLVCINGVRRTIIKKEDYLYILFKKMEMKK